MDYFEVFDVPRRLVLDDEAIRSTYLSLSRRAHPDFHATAGEAERSNSLRETSLINNAYKTLRDPQKRAEYLISLETPDLQSNKNAVPPELLEEIFDIQEAGEELREARTSGDAESLAQAEARVKPLQQQVSAARRDLEAGLQRHFENHDQARGAGDTEAATAELRSVRQKLDQMNYLRTVIRNLK